MKGYKIAVGIDRKYGPFLCMVELETHPKATIIKPYLEPQIFGGISLPSRRTDMAAIKSVTPLKAPHKNWNGKAYSLFQLCKPYQNFVRIVYEEGVLVTSRLNTDESEPCGLGIHFFESEEDATLYLKEDICFYLENSIRYVKKLWNIGKADGSPYASKRKLLKELSK